MNYDSTTALEERVAALEAKVERLEMGRKGGRKGKKIQMIGEGICGIDPERDSSTCPDASLHRRRQGCLGAACKQASSDYYKRYDRE